MRWHSCMAGGRWPQSADDGARPGQLIIDDLHGGGRCGAVRCSAWARKQQTWPLDIRLFPSVALARQIRTWRMEE